MLKAILAGVLFLPALVVAQQQGPVRVEKPVLCDNTDVVFETISKDWKEKPIWGSVKEDSRVMITVNQETQTWTIVQFNDEWACLIEAGEGYHFKLEGT